MSISIICFLVLLVTYVSFFPLLVLCFPVISIPMLFSQLGLSVTLSLTQISLLRLSSCCWYALPVRLHISSCRLLDQLEISNLQFIQVEQFVKFYYDTFDGKGPTEPKGREALRGLYVCGEPQSKTYVAVIANNEDTSMMSRC